MKKIFVAMALTISSVSSFAGLPEMMKIYNNPKLAPKVAVCKGDAYCNGFIALSKQWKDIPNSYRYQGEWDIKVYAREGITYNSRGNNVGLHKGFYWYTDKSINFLQSIQTKQNFSKNNNIEGGLAVLLYIEDKKGWAKD